jgi:hypothetical protein
MKSATSAMAQSTFLPRPRGPLACFSPRPGITGRNPDYLA